MKIKLQNTLLDRLESFYKFDGSLGYAKDETGNNNGVLSNVIQDSSGIINQGFYFDPSANSYITLANDYVFTTNHSISWWSKLNHKDYQGIVGGNLGLRAYLRFGAGAFPSSADFLHRILGETNTDGDNIILTFLTPIAVDEWHHYVITQDDKMVWRLYKDGIFQSSSGPRTNPDLTIRLIGKGRTSITDNYYGNMDEMGIWSKVLSMSEIQMLYNNGNGLSYNFKNQNLTLPVVQKEKLQITNQYNKIKLTNDTLLNGIAAYYKLDDSSNNVLDSTPNGRHCTNNNAFPLQPGKIGTSYGFNQIIARSISTTVNGLTTSIGITCACWVYYNGFVGNQNTFIRIGTQSGIIPFHWWYISSGGTILNWQTSNMFARVQANYSLSYTFPVGVWTHAAVTHDYKEKRRIFYINGSRINTNTSATITPVQLNNTPYSIGSYGSPANTFNGSLDEFGIWNRALSDDEVLRLYNNGNGLTYPFK